MGDGPAGAVVVLDLVEVVVDDFTAVEVVVEATGSGPSHRRQYSLPTTKALQITPAFHLVNWSTLIPQVEAIVWQVSPFSAAHVNEQSRGRRTAAALVRLKRATVPRKD